MAIIATISTTAARADLYRLIEQVNEDSQPLTITGQRGNAVLVGEADWQAIRETLQLEAVPGLVESVKQAHEEGIDSGSTTLNW